MVNGEKQKLKNVLEELAESKLVRVTGSYADGTETPTSDIDFYVKEDRPDTPIEKRNILKVIVIMEKFGIKCASHFSGYIHTVDFPIQLEFSDLFQPREGRLKEVSIEGVRFKTY